MFGFGNDKNKKDKRAEGVSGQKSVNQTPKNKPKTKPEEGRGEQDSHVGNQKGQALGGDELRAQALANARVAREALGEDTIGRVASILQQQQTKQQKLQDEIAQADAERVAQEILLMIAVKD